MYTRHSKIVIYNVFICISRFKKTSICVLHLQHYVLLRLVVNTQICSQLKVKALAQFVSTGLNLIPDRAVPAPARRTMKQKQTMMPSILHMCVQEWAKQQRRRLLSMQQLSVWFKVKALAKTPLATAGVFADRTTKHECERFELKALVLKTHSKKWLMPGCSYTSVRRPTGQIRAPPTVPAACICRHPRQLQTAGACCWGLMCQWDLIML